MSLIWKDANLNDYIEVTLLEKGKQLVLAHVGRYAELRQLTKKTIEQNADILYPDWRTGKLKIQIWCLLELLGVEIHIGMSDLIDNSFKIQVKE